MKRTDSVFLAIALAVTAFAAGYYINPPAPRYYPLERTWRMTKEQGKPSMGWYGRSAWGLGAAGLVGALAFAATRRLPSREGNESRLPLWIVRLLTVIALAALVVVAAHIVVHEFSVYGTWGTWELPSPTR